VALRIPPRRAAGLALIAVAGVIALSGGRGDSDPTLKAVFALQRAGPTHPGDVYVTAAARRVLCSDLPDSDPRPSPG
jgi:hypothetical protein